ncbi:MAG: endoglucanase [Methanobrevibacter sp.]|nr:endoglucanase [Methanobrevibacter sp.]
MDNSNIIISVIIVLCIAAGVTAYGISEGDNAVFNDLTGFTPDSSSSGDNVISDLFNDGSADGTGDASNNGGSSSSGSSSGSSGGTNSNGGGNSGSNSNGGSGSGGNSGGSGSSSQTKITPAQAKSIVNNNFIGEAGAYVSNVKDDGTQYICYISNANGTVVDAIAISYSGENLGKI